jgi:hypothetical protein
MTPDALTLEEVLEQMLPLCNDDAFEVAEWLDDHFKKAKIRLLADGIVVPPHLYPTHLAVVAKIAPDGRASLQVVLRRTFGVPKKVKAEPTWKTHLAVVAEMVGAVLGYDKSGDESIEQWTVERRSFEANREQQESKLITNPRGAGTKRKFDREFILTEAAAYVVTDDLPSTLEELVHALQSTLGDKMPKDTQGKNILGPFFLRMKQALGR